MKSGMLIALSATKSLTTSPSALMPATTAWALKLTFLMEIVGLVVPARDHTLRLRNGELTKQASSIQISYARCR